MEANEAAEMMEQEKISDKFKQRAAILIAVLAMLLAITALGGSNAGKEAVNNNVFASNYYSFYQAKNARQTAIMLAADQIELAVLNDQSVPEAAKTELKKKVEAYRKTIARYESEPETGEGKKELLVRAKEFETKRDHALRQDPYFDYAEALLQIAIVLISVAIIAELSWLMVVGGALGCIGTLLMVNGFLLLVEVPFLS
ncbi:MAG: DUF4337 family protein [Pseudorhodoplanes sp.]|nr:hypothetical protein [Pseudorhodoplanes sp.]MCL4712693.1 DUF4337 family protein [Pseudorhodoplanes sp.]GIK82386.1 MAG: hypothetical protein BroJett024_34910 [Alphaproteobacteria bacterium]